MSDGRSDTAEGARTTIVVVPRERFSKARESLESLFANTSTPFRLVYVDGGSPPSLRDWLEEQSRSRGFRLLRYERFLSPNEARNIGFAQVDTEYVVFLDNDVLFKPGWLSKLIECADETGAAVVGPLTYEGNFHAIHVAGGEFEIRENGANGVPVRSIHEELYLHEQALPPEEVELGRQECTLTEFHCMLVRTDMLERIGGLDEGMLNSREHLDLCLEVSRSGGSVWFEPKSVVTCLTAGAWSASTPFPRLELRDVPYYMLRWSDDWERRSLSHFQTKWGLTEDEFFLSRLERLGWRRQAALVRPVVRRLTLGRGSSTVERAISPLERQLNRWLVRRAARAREGASGGAPAVLAGRR